MSCHCENVSIRMSPPKPVHQYASGGLKVNVYGSPEEMGLASALSVASLQCQLVAENGKTSMIIMAAPSAYSFYEAYVRLAQCSAGLQRALRATHLFQFDDYPLPVHHPASFRFLLLRRFIMPLSQYLDPANVHLFDADSKDPDAACRSYGQMILDYGPDLQLKGLGENGHWGFHEPGVLLDTEPSFMKVHLTVDNVTQQMRDHPSLFESPYAVPKEAYTANVSLFLRTRRLIEENVPQASKAFALLAAYGSDVVDSCMPSSALKQHSNAVIRTTTSSAWALLEYLKRGVVSVKVQNSLVEALMPGMNGDRAASLARIRDVLNRMAIRCE